MKYETAHGVVFKKRGKGALSNSKIGKWQNAISFRGFHGGRKRGKGVAVTRFYAGEGRRKRRAKRRRSRGGQQRGAPINEWAEWRHRRGGQQIGPPIGENWWRHERFPVMPKTIFKPMTGSGSGPAFEYKGAAGVWML